MISILLPTYNQAKFLPAALAGLRAQTFRDFEVIACDDASTDETGTILADAGIRTITHKVNHGTAYAINQAWALSGCELITWISSDNVMRPTWLETLARYLKANPHAGAVYSAYVRHEGEKATEVHPNYPAGSLIESENSYFGPSFLIRSEVWQDHRGGTAHDYDNWARVEEACWARGWHIGYVDDLLCDYHVGPWCTARKHPERYDAGKWRAQAIERRKQCGSALSLR
jgi:glycosyltransferase involved in cell wall biosynthesis